MPIKPSVVHVPKPTPNPPDKPDRKLGWLPDTPDIRDLTFDEIKPQLPIIPRIVDFRQEMPEVWEQGYTSSCTSQCLSAALMHEREKQNEIPRFIPSRLFIYYNTRVLEDTVNSDAGAYIRSSIKTVVKTGFCDEKLWPFDVNKILKQPPKIAYSKATLYKLLKYYRINNNNLDHLKLCLAAGYPFIFGSAIYDSFYNADSNGGFVPMPSRRDVMQGGHAMLACGYNDDTKMFVIRNSWGVNCGDRGYYYLPYDYVTNTNISDDFWTIRRTIDTDGI